MAALKDRISADMVAAMKARDQVRVDTLRSALSGFTYKRSEAGVDLTEADELAVVAKQVKQRTDSFTEFTKAGRTDLASKEATEREILQAYLPAQKSAEEIRTIVQTAVDSLPPEARNQGAIMKIVMPQLKGLADGNLVREAVTTALA
ncbi:MAG: GatB/YqeY domain-containing protein [Candidatus Eremiobacteraeota bacterium]|nr:GatB/YqeY domain-containing protein [Candidatus Eremiobacteraeota bacterium]